MGWRAAHDYYVWLIAYECLSCYFAEHLDDYAARLMLSRLRHILLHLDNEGERPLNGASGYHQHDNYGYYPPGLNNLSHLLRTGIRIADYEEEFRAMLAGEWCAKNSYQRYAYKVSRLFHRALRHFADQGKLDYPQFRHLMRLAPSLLDADLLQPASADDAEDGVGQSALLREYTGRLAWDEFQAVDEEAMGVLHEFRYSHPTGGRWLCKACEHIDRRQYTASVVNDSYDDLSRVLTGFLGIAKLDPEETEDSLVERLRGFTPQTLWVALPFSGAGQRAVLKALGCAGLIPLHEQVFRLAGAKPYQPSPSTNDVPNSENTESGVINQAEWAASLEGLSDKPLNAYFKALKGSGLGFKNTVLLIEAFRGKNRPALERALAKHGQAAMKAFGLLPVESKEDVLARYLALKKAWKECAKYGAERQANTRAAVTVGLKNLAVRAGYRDAARMEWDLEAEISQESANLEEPRTIEQWDVIVSFEGVKPILSVSKQGKGLKSVPPGLRKTAEYAALRETLNRLKDQASRFRKSLETMMIDGEVIPLEELGKLVRIPAVGFLLSNLVAINESDDIGLVDPASLTLVDGERRHPIRETLRLAHVYDLFSRNVLSHWQQVIVGQQRIQPFKQVFRELYILTPAEQETGDFSNRFAGHTIDSAIAYRLLQARGWSSSSDDVPDVFKRFPEYRFRAHWEFPDARHYFVEEPQLNSDKIVFRRGWDALPLSEIPPVVFSEVMRDADLVVSVANIADQGEYWSSEASQHRLSVVRTIAQHLGLGNLHFDGNFVFIKGRLAEYRIHLGSGNIHVMPGNYLCIVPDHTQKKSERLYLPFADADSKTAEIISKILMLHNDHRIKDESILSQIRRCA